MSKDEERGADHNMMWHKKKKKKKKINVEDLSSHKEIEALNNSPKYGANGSSKVLEPQDADYSYVPLLSDEIALLILARVPRSEYQRLCFVNRRYQSLVQGGELYSIRKEIGIKEPSILMLASGESNWWCYDPRSGTRRNLPVLPADECFSSFDKESLCAGTHLLVSGKEISGSVIWRYELASDRWFKGPLMINPRCLFASANCGNEACVAGGVAPSLEILNTAEKYDPESKSWNQLPRMNRRRKLCSGCYMDKKFYVIGGQNEKGDNLTCGEYYDAKKNAWELIPDMLLKDAPAWSSRSPPLVAVVNNELYSLEASSNRLKVYLKKSNSWKDLGKAPVRADHSRGWGVAFKSLGDELLVIGSTALTYAVRGMMICTCKPDPESEGYAVRGMMICTCKPDPESETLRWRVLENNGLQWSSFIFNCSIMVA